jgi:hypothetical protein
MPDGEFKLAQLWLGQIYLMGLRYIRSKVVTWYWNPTRVDTMGSDMSDRGTCHVSGTRWRSDKSGWSDNLTWGRICPTWVGYQASGIRWKSLTWSPTKLTREGIKGFARGLSTPIIFHGFVVSLLIVPHAYDSKININSFLSRAHHFFFFFFNWSIT